MNTIFERNGSTIVRYTRLKLSVSILVLFMIGISACQTNFDVPSSTEQPTKVEEQAGNEGSEKKTNQNNQPDQPMSSEPEETPISNEHSEVGKADPEVIVTSWESSPHADTFILDEAGNNNNCARCHAPVVWLPSMEDMPETCFACKFEVSDPPSLIPEDAWVTIECIVCHEVDKKGNVAAEYSWLEIAQIEEYAEVGTPTELCQKCHVDVGLAGHSVAQLDGAHAEYECTDCHDAHATLASCAADGCHDNVLEPADPILGHDEDHQQVSCVACHDSGEMIVDFDEQLERWTTYVLGSAGGEERDPLISHNIVLAAPCERCHYDENPWNILEEVSLQP